MIFLNKSARKSCKIFEVANDITNLIQEPTFIPHISDVRTNPLDISLTTKREAHSTDLMWPKIFADWDGLLFPRLQYASLPQTLNDIRKEEMIYVFHECMEVSLQIPSIKVVTWTRSNGSQLTGMISDSIVEVPKVP